MEFTLVPTTFFLKQAEELSDDAARLVAEKLLLAKQNPYRFKRVHRDGLFLFRIRFEDGRKEKRIIYEVERPRINVLCILDRDKEYRDLERYLRTLGRQHM